MTKDEKWMKIAIEEAIKAQDKGEVPVGAIIVQDSLLIAKAHNQCISSNDPSAHAEIQVLRKAGEKLKNYRLNGTSLYVTLEPCAMCLGAIMHARIDCIIYGAYDTKTGVCGSCEDLSSAKFFNHRIQINGGILQDSCRNLLQNFFKNRR
jgi:tRNA(adenine34) deaminase